MVIFRLLCNKFCVDLGVLWCPFCLFWVTLFESLPWLPSQLSSTSVLVLIERISKTTLLIILTLLCGWQQATHPCCYLLSCVTDSQYKYHHCSVWREEPVKPDTPSQCASIGHPLSQFVYKLMSFCTSSVVKYILHPLFHQFLYWCSALGLLLQNQR